MLTNGPPVAHSSSPSQSDEAEQLQPSGNGGCCSQPTPPPPWHVESVRELVWHVTEQHSLSSEHLSPFSKHTPQARSNGEANLDGTGGGNTACAGATGGGAGPGGSAIEGHGSSPWVPVSSVRTRPFSETQPCTKESEKHSTSPTNKPHANTLILICVPCSSPVASTQLGKVPSVLLARISESVGGLEVVKVCVSVLVMQVPWAPFWLDTVPWEAGSEPSTSNSTSIPPWGAMYVKSTGLAA